MRRTLLGAAPRTELPQLLLGKCVVENCPFGKIPVRDGAIAARPLVAENPGRTVVCDASRPRLSIQSRGEGGWQRENPCKACRRPDLRHAEIFAGQVDTWVNRLHCLATGP